MFLYVIVYLVVPNREFLNTVKPLIGLEAD